MDDKFPERKLLAILSCDIVGSTNTSLLHGEVEVRDAKAKIYEISQPVITKRHGKMFKDTGDGFLGCFESSYYAVDSAIAIQEQASQLNLLVSIRIGIHKADVEITPSGDLHGIGVGKTVRIESHAPHGRIVVSEDIVRECREPFGSKVSFNPLKELSELKGWAEKVQLYLVSASASLSQQPVYSSFSAAASDNGTFERFCHEKLGYFSRADYAKCFDLDRANQQDETVILRSFLSSELSRFLIVYGTGGSGKTRLLQCFAEVLADSEIHVLHAIRHVQIELADLQRFDRGQRYVLIVDYEDAHGSLAKVCDWIITQPQSFVRLIIACRSSALETVRLAIGERYVRLVDVDSAAAQAGQQSYLEWVTRSILRRCFNPHVADKLYGSCAGIPAVAAFLCFYSRKQARVVGDDNPLKSLENLEDFREWVLSRSRAAITSAAGKSDETKIICLLLSLPIKDVTDFDGKIFESLLNDGFIIAAEDESDIVEYRAAHDIFIDIIVTGWLFSHRTQLEIIKLRESMKSILQASRWTTNWTEACRIFDRLDLKRRPEVRDAVSGSLFDLSKVVPSTDLASASIILQSETVTSDHKARIALRVFEDCGGAIHPSAASVSGGALDFMDWIDANVRAIVLAAKGAPVHQPRLLRFLEELITTTDWSTAESNRNLVEAYLVFPEKFAPHLERLCDDKNWRAIYAINALCKRADPSVLLQCSGLIRSVLMRYYYLEDARFVFHNWLAKTKDHAFIKPFVVGWLHKGSERVGSFIESDATYHLFISWLIAGGPLKSIRREFVDWQHRKIASLTRGPRSLILYCLSEPTLHDGLDPENVLYLKETAETYLVNREPLSFDDHDHELVALLVWKGWMTPRLFDHFKETKLTLWLFSFCLDWVKHGAWNAGIEKVYRETWPSIPARGQERRSVGKLLVAWDVLLNANVELQKTHRDRIETWLAIEDTGRKSFFDHWHRVHHSLEPFSEAALACLRTPGNREEMEKYPGVPEWVREVMELDSRADSGIQFSTRI